MTGGEIQKSGNEEASGMPIKDCTATLIRTHLQKKPKGSLTPRDPARPRTTPRPRETPHAPRTHPTPSRRGLSRAWEGSGRPAGTRTVARKPWQATWDTLDSPRGVSRGPVGSRGPTGCVRGLAGSRGVSIPGGFFFKRARIGGAVQSFMGISEGTTFSEFRISHPIKNLGSHKF